MGSEAALISQLSDKASAMAGTPVRVAGGVMNLIEAGKQGDAQRSADRVAEQAVAEAKQLKETNFLGAVQVPVEAYNQAMDLVTRNQMQSVNALQEAGPRELAGGIGRVDAVANDQINDINNQKINNLYSLSLAQANEQGQTNEGLAGLSLAQAEGAQRASMAAQLAKRALQQGALSAFGSAITQTADAATPVYKQGQQEVSSPVSQMQGVTIPEPQAPMIQNQQLQGIASPETQRMLEMFMKNYR
jgi:hypothetical protein